MTKRAAFLALALAAGLAFGGTVRQVPHPQAEHPGNIFVIGEDVFIRNVEPVGKPWRLIDFEGRTVAQGTTSEGGVRLGKLAAGYYELTIPQEPGSKTLSLGVIEPLRAPTPTTSPICIDVAAAWLVPADKMAAIANLSALAGINWVRDRLNWEELEPARGDFTETNKYDRSVDIQAKAGLQVLEVSHRSPRWAAGNPERFPDDLRDVYNYHKTLAARWRGKVGAFEPWNEADITMFGGHTGSEMASLQKAAFLGLKAGNPKVIACLNVFALHRNSTLTDLADNQASPYFDTFNLHHYEPFSNYPRLYADFRAVSAGKPLWVTECSVPVKWSGDPSLEEPTPEDLREQSERIAKTYALALQEGARTVFYFILPHFVEGKTQFGILKRDLSPRPAYVALAAAGRFLADARPLGKLQLDGAQAYAFRAKPDGKKSDLLVLWAEKETAVSLPVKPAASFDHLGRAMSFKGQEIPVGRAPIYVLLPPRTRLPLEQPPLSESARRNKPSPLVLQALMPRKDLNLEQSAYQFVPGEPLNLQLYLYNFGTRATRGDLPAAAPPGWKLEISANFEINPGERVLVPLEVTSPNTVADLQTLRLAYQSSNSGKAVISVRLLPKK